MISLLRQSVNIRSTGTPEADSFSWFSVSSPYETQQPRLGRPAIHDHEKAIIKKGVVKTNFSRLSIPGAAVIVGQEKGGITEKQIKVWESPARKRVAFTVRHHTVINVVGFQQRPEGLIYIELYGKRGWVSETVVR